MKNKKKALRGALWGKRPRRIYIAGELAEVKPYGSPDSYKSLNDIPGFNEAMKQSAAELGRLMGSEKRSVAQDGPYHGADFMQKCADEVKDSLEQTKRRLDKKNEILYGGPRGQGRVMALLDYFRGYSDAKMNQPDPCIHDWIILGIVETFEQLQAVLESVGLVERIKEAQWDTAKRMIAQALPKEMKGGGHDVKKE
ncbi:MAG: hypothetical protein WC356_03450 [Candidatus Micrarchaeia archaeon]|jgi:hypothetical protein